MLRSGQNVMRNLQDDLVMKDLLAYELLIVTLQQHYHPHPKMLASSFLFVGHSM